ncbi:hypothetical protein JCM8097_007428 [Rhodosporidiobolus ruineniae]
MLPDDFEYTTSDPDELRALYADLRSRCPVAHTSQYGGVWTLTRHADIAAAAQDSALFISSVKAVVPSDQRGLRRPPLNLDAPDHTPFRRALDRTLKPSRLAHLESRLREHSLVELERMLEKGGGDIAGEYGARFPAYAETTWLNLDEEQAPYLAETAAAWVDAWRKQDGETVSKHSQNLYAIARELVASRKVELRDPEQQLRENLEDVPAAVDEFIRMYSPYRGFARTVKEPVTLHGRTINPGEPVTMTYTAANRDPEVFPDPDTFILHRSNIAQHLGFGKGRHACAGRNLAKLMINISVHDLLEQTSSFSLAGECEGALMPELGYISCPLKMERRL